MAGWKINLLRITFKYIFKSQCLSSRNLIVEAVASRALDSTTAAVLSEEVREFEQAKQIRQSRPILNSSNQLHYAVRVSIITGAIFEVPVTATTTVKDVKLHVGHALEREPRSIRLIHNGIELKVFCH